MGGKVGQGSRKSGKYWGGESAVMCCDFSEVGKVEHIFSIFPVKNSTNLSAKSRGGFINGSILAGSLCNASPRTRHNFWVMVIILNFCFKEFRFGLHVDSIILVDFMHVLRSIEGRFISEPSPFKQTLGLSCRNYSFVNPSWDYFALVCLV